MGAEVGIKRETVALASAAKVQEATVEDRDAGAAAARNEAAARASARGVADDVAKQMADAQCENERLR